jgi:hypothetical protein
MMRGCGLINGLINYLDSQICWNFAETHSRFGIAVVPLAKPSPAHFRLHMTPLVHHCDVSLLAKFESHLNIYLDFSWRFSISALAEWSRLDFTHRLEDPSADTGWLIWLKGFL